MMRNKSHHFYFMMMRGGSNPNDILIIVVVHGQDQIKNLCVSGRKLTSLVSDWDIILISAPKRTWIRVVTDIVIARSTGICLI